MITFVRHAKTEFNNTRKFQGQLDLNLSEIGINETIEKSKDFPQDFDICFCSPLKRTRQTAEILVPNMSLNFDDRIMERNMGDWEGAKITDERLAQLNSTFTPPNGEAPASMDKRVSDFLNMINEKYKEKNVLVVTHSGVIHSVGRILSKDMSTIEHLKPISIEL